MTEEIKEILEDIKNTEECSLSGKNALFLLDYITNLQQLYENGLKVNQNSHKYITELEDKYVVLQQENERLKEDLDKANDIIQKDRQFYKCRMDEYAELKKENEILRKNAEHNDKVVDKARWNEMIYKSRCEKAIEYIENNKKETSSHFNGKEYVYRNFTLCCEPNDLLNILNGSGNNE